MDHCFAERSHCFVHYTGRVVSGLAHKDELTPILRVPLCVTSGPSKIGIPTGGSQVVNSSIRVGTSRYIGKGAHGPSLKVIRIGTAAAEIGKGITGRDRGQLRLLLLPPIQ